MFKKLLGKKDAGTTSTLPSQLENHAQNILPVQLLDYSQASTGQATLSGHSGYITALQLLPDGRLATGSADKTIKIWDVTSGRCEQTLSGHTVYIYALTLLRDGRLASGSQDTTIKIWNVVSGRCEQTLKGHSESISALLLLADGRLVSGSWDKTIKIWDVPSGRCEQTLGGIFKGHSSRIITLTSLPDDRLASGSTDETIKIWDVKRGRCEQTLNGYGGDVEVLTPLSDGRLASGSSDRTIKIWDVTSGRCEQTLSGHSSSVRALMLLPDGRLASGAGDQTIKIWDLTSGRCEQTLSAGYVYCLQLLSDGRLAIGSSKIIKLWSFPPLQPTPMPASTLSLTTVGPRPFPVSLPTAEQLIAPVTAVAATAPTQAKAPPPMPTKQLIPPAANLALSSPSSSRNSIGTLDTQGVIQLSLSIKSSDLTYGKELGGGGFGVVYQGTWRHDTVAIKQLRLQRLSANMLDDFQREASIMARLRSSFIVQLYGVCLEPGQYSMVMEYMLNGSLYDKLHSQQKFGWPDKERIGLEIAYGLDFLHTEDILHRDIKSLNVLLDNQNRAKLTDFGLSKIKTETTSTTTAQQGAGSLLWMPPEMFSMKGKYTQKSDVYSYAITLWEIASESLPYENAQGNAAIIKEWVKDGEREDIPTGTPKVFAQVIERCWSAKPDDRPTIRDVITLFRTNSSANSSNAAATSSNPSYMDNLASQAASASGYQRNLLTKHL